MPGRLRIRRKAAAGRNFLPAPTTVQAQAAVRITVQLLITVQALEFPPLIALTMRRRATLAETAGLRWICTGLSLRRESSRVIHRPRNGTSQDTIRRHNTMSLVTIHLRRAMNRVGHTQAQAQARDRTTVVAAHTRAAAVEGRHLMAAGDHRPTVAEVTANHTRARAPAPIAARGSSKNTCREAARRKQNERRTTNRRSFCA